MREWGVWFRGLDHWGWCYYEKGPINENNQMYIRNAAAEEHEHPDREMNRRIGPIRFNTLISISRLHHWHYHILACTSTILDFWMGSNALPRIQSGMPGLYWKPDSRVSNKRPHSATTYYDNLYVMDLPRFFWDYSQTVRCKTAISELTPVKFLHCSKRLYSSVTCQL
jgi:hypothetical protein